MARNVFLQGKIDKDCANDIIRAIISVNELDNDNERKYKHYSREPITLFINSQGGDVVQARAIADCMKLSDTPIHTYVLGECSSAAVLVFVSSDTRIISPSSEIMLHRGNRQIMGNIPYIESLCNDSAILERKYFIPISKIMNMSIDDIFKNINDNGDYWKIPAEEAISLGLATKIAEKLNSEDEHEEDSES